MTTVPGSIVKVIPFGTVTVSVTKISPDQISSLKRVPSLVVLETFVGPSFSNSSSTAGETSRKKYFDVIEKYGTDKPDIRFEIPIVDITDELLSTDFQLFKNAIENKVRIKGINVNDAANFSRKKINTLSVVAKDLGAKQIVWIKVRESGELQSSIAKYLKDDEKRAILDRFEAKSGDLIILIADLSNKASTILGQIRLYLANELDLIPEDTYKFLWVYDFPLFEWDDDEKRYQPMHHPFTSPTEETIEFIKNDPLKVKAKAYDLILNGVEIASGSIRINNSNLQKEIFKVLGHDKDKVDSNFGFLLEAFQYGAPPLGGIAYGFDRFVAEVLQKKNIREVIAFSKTLRAICPLTGAPDKVTDEQLEELNIDIKKK